MSNFAEVAQKKYGLTADKLNELYQALNKLDEDYQEDVYTHDDYYQAFKDVLAKFDIEEDKTGEFVKNLYDDGKYNDFLNVVLMSASIGLYDDFDKFHNIYMPILKFENRDFEGDAETPWDLKLD